MSYFEHIPAIRYEGPQSDNPLAYRHYDRTKRVLGKTLEEHLRIAVCYWHTFVWPGQDVFGQGALRRPWQQPGEPLERARQKADAAFAFFTKLGTPFYTFHDTDVAPEGANLHEYVENFARMVDYLGEHQQASGVRLLWGTANLFSHPRFAAGAATSPNPDAFAWAATQVCHALDATHRLGGENYVLWGGREGYETLLNTDLAREREQLARFLAMVVEHKHRIGFTGALLIEPKPQEPTKHQYDYDVATVHGLLTQYGLQNEIRVNIEANHATLAGHSFHHEIANAHVSQLKHRVSCGLRAARRDRPVMEPVPASFVRHAKNGAERTATRRHRTDRREIQRGNPRPAAARRPAASNLAMPARNRRAFLAANGAQRASPDEIKRIPERSNSAAI